MNSAAIYALYSHYLRFHYTTIYQHLLLAAQQRARTVAQLLLLLGLPLTTATTQLLLLRQPLTTATTQLLLLLLLLRQPMTTAATQLLLLVTHAGPSCARAVGAA